MVDNQPCYFSTAKVKWYKHKSNFEVTKLLKKIKKALERERKRERERERERERDES